jgi:ferritin
MLKKSVEKAFNDQLNAETYSAYLYWSMSAWCEKNNLPGFANWMRVQVQEENFHGMKFYDYIINRQGRVILKAIDAPPSKWKSPLEVFREVYVHEQKVTGLINKLATLARKEDDHATAVLLHWFINEQVEEEANADAIIQKLKMIGDNSSGIFLLDQELAARVFTPPAAGAAA